MNKIQYLMLLLILVYACDKDKKDSTPPTITIISPAMGDTVYEIIDVEFLAKDNDKVDYVELWVNGDSTGLADSSEPFLIKWDANIVGNDNYFFKGKAIDRNSNSNFSDSVQIIVDNNLAAPNKVSIISITYTTSKLLITFNRSYDSDFYSYNIYTSFFENIDIDEFTKIYHTTDKEEISYETDQYDPSRPTYYFIEVVDLYGYSSFSDPYLVQEKAPDASILSPPEYRNGNFIFNWTENSNNDFMSYSIYESDNIDMISKQKIQEIFFQNQITKTIQVSLLSPTKYYQIGVKDTWGAESYSEPREATFPFNFIKTYGGNGNDVIVDGLFDISNNSYMLVGYTTSYGAGSSDVWFLKVNLEGEIDWYKTFGGSLNDRGSKIIKTSDGGYIITGYSSSFSNGSKDIWVIKTNMNGESCSDYYDDGNCFDNSSSWIKSHGTTNDDSGNDIVELDEGGYVITGKTSLLPSLLVMRINSSGGNVWTKNYGTSGNDIGNYVEQENNFLKIIGRENINGDIDVNYLNLELNGFENISEHKTFGGPGSDIALYISKAIHTDGGFLISGLTRSLGNGDFDDAWIVKCNSTGIMEWQNNLGGNYSEQGYYIQQYTSGDNLIVGHTESYGQGLYDIWVALTDVNGNFKSYQTFGGANDDKSFTSIKSPTDGVLIIGATKSFGSGGYDLLLMEINNNYNP